MIIEDIQDVHKALETWGKTPAGRAWLLLRCNDIQLRINSLYELYTRWTASNPGAAEDILSQLDNLQVLIGKAYNEVQS